MFRDPKRMHARAFFSLRVVSTGLSSIRIGNASPKAPLQKPGLRLIAICSFQLSNCLSILMNPLPLIFNTPIVVCITLCWEDSISGGVGGVNINPRPQTLRGRGLKIRARLQPRNSLWLSCTSVLTHAC